MAKQNLMGFEQQFSFSNMPHSEAVSMVPRNMAISAGKFKLLNDQNFAVNQSGIYLQSSCNQLKSFSGDAANFTLEDMTKTEQGTTAKKPMGIEIKN